MKKAREAQHAITPADAPLNEAERLELIRLRAELKNKDAENAELRMQVASQVVAVEDPAVVSPASCVPDWPGWPANHRHGAVAHSTGPEPVMTMPSRNRHSRVGRRN